MALALCAGVRASPASWEAAGWGGGGFFWSALIDPRGQGTFYLGGDVAGIYKTQDHGLHWHFINRGLNNYAVYSLALCAGDSQFRDVMRGPGLVHRSSATGYARRHVRGAQYKFGTQHELGAMASRPSGDRQW